VQYTQLRGFNMATLLDLEVVAGDQSVITITNDTGGATLTASIVDANLNTVEALSSTLNGAGTSGTVTIPATTTLSARKVGTILQLAWDYGSGQIKNTRVNLVGVK